MECDSCMIDRVCTKRMIQHNYIHVLTEEWKGQIVVYTTKENNKVPFQGNKVIFTDNIHFAEFLLYKKLSLVNGLHTIIAFFTLIQELKDNNFNKSLIKLPGNYPLSRFSSLDIKDKKIILSWIILKCYILYHKYSIKLLKLYFKTDKANCIIYNLVEYAFCSIDRFENTTDTTKRVLNAGVSKRFETRIKQPSMFVYAMENFKTTMFNPISTIVCKYSKIKDLSLRKTEVCKYINHFVKISYEFMLEDKKESI